MKGTRRTLLIISAVCLVALVAVVSHDFLKPDDVSRSVGAPATVQPDASSPHDGMEADPLASGRPLVQIYTDNQRSLDPAERSLAWHAWSLCLPSLFAAAESRASDAAYQSPSGGSALDGPRRSAIAAITTRCKSSATTSLQRLKEEAIANAERHRAGDLRSRGELAAEAVRAGNHVEAVRLIQEIAERRSAYEFRDLSGLVARWHRDDPQADDGIRDAALAVVGCDLGMDCSADSPLALELCAYNHLCEGDLVERTLKSFPDINRQELNKFRVETARRILNGQFDANEYFHPPNP